MKPLVLLMPLLLVLTACSQEATPALDDFARCLTQSGATMYGASWCPHCNDQKEMFGSSVHLV
ncbi:MAG: hypothetical protein ABIH41_05485, partial [Nanoarchaeota archaeon]